VSVGLDDAGLEQFFFIQGMQKGERIGSGLHPVTLGGARNQNIFAGKDFCWRLFGSPSSSLPTMISASRRGPA